MDQTPETRSLKEIFNQSAEDMRRAFPNFESLYIGTMKETIYVSEAAARQLAESVVPLKNQLNQRIYYMTYSNAAGLAFTLDGASQKIGGILVDDVNNRPQRQVYVSPACANVIDLTTVLDHEIGHQVVSGGRNAPTAQLRECIADAFAALRHVQRFGNTTDLFAYAPFTRARIIAHGYSAAHYTAAVFEKVEELGKKIDLSELSLRETATLARDIAYACQLPDETLERIKKAFLPLSFYFDADQIRRDDTYSLTPATHPVYFKVLLNILRDNKDDADVRLTGARLIKHHMPGIEAEAKLGKEAFWQEILDFTAQDDRQPAVPKHRAPAQSQNITPR